MAKYTETLAEWLEAGNSLPTEFADVDGLENAFLGRYADREIGFETPYLFGLKLKAKAGEVCPLYAGRGALIDVAEKALLGTGSKKVKVDNGPTKGKVTEMPIDSSNSQPNAVTETEASEVTTEYSGLSVDEGARALDFFERKKADLAGKCADEFASLFMQVY